MSEWVKSRRVWGLLESEFGLELSTFHVEPLERYAALLSEWNDLAGLMSKQQFPEGIDDHIADSWTLLPYCAPNDSHTLLDIGSGGGFPGLPIAVAYQRLCVTLLDRKEKKTNFLKRVVLQMKLDNVEIIRGSFPHAVHDREFDYLTARAVERPAQLRVDLARSLANGATFLCQSESALPDANDVSIMRVEDAFQGTTLRRGDLWIVRRAGQSVANQTAQE